MKKLLSLSLALLLVVMSLPQMSFAQEGFSVSVDTVETTSAIATLSRELTGNVTATLNPAVGSAVVSGTTVTLSGLTQATAYELTVSEDVDVFADNTYTVTREGGSGNRRYYYTSPFVAERVEISASDAYHFERRFSWDIFAIFGYVRVNGYESGYTNYIDVTEKTGTSNATATDTFTTAADTFTLDITAVNGSVTRSVEGPYAPGTEVTLTAVADSNYHFAGWSNDLGSTEAITVTMNDNMALTASFAINSYPVTFYDGEAIIFGPNNIEHGSMPSWPLAPTKSGFVFNGWTVGDAAFDPSEPITGPTDVYANWLPVNLYFTVDNVMKIYHNGVELSPVFTPSGGDHDWQRIKYYFADLAEGDVIAIEGTDLGVIAGMMGEIHFDGQVYPTQSESHWMQSINPQDDWKNKGIALDDTWGPVTEKYNEQWVGLQGLPDGFDAEWVWTDNNDFENGGDQVVYFRYVIGGYVPPQPDMVTITFDTDGGSTVAPISIPEGTSLNANEISLPIPSKGGFTFDKWIYGEGATFEGSTEVEQSMTVLAVYIADEEDEEEEEEENNQPTNETPTQEEVIVPIAVATTEATEELEEEEVALAGVPYDLDSIYAAVDEIDVVEEAVEEEVILDEEVALADALPKTGHLPVELFFGIGGLISAAGIYLKKK